MTPSRHEPGSSKEPVPARAPSPDEEAERHEAEVHAERASHSLLRGLISLALLVAIVVGLLLAIPGLHGVARTVTRMPAGWVVAAIGFEILACIGYVIAFLQVFERAPVRFGARVALSELAFNPAVLFLLTSAANVITFVLAGGGVGSCILSGPSNPLLGWVPAAVGTVVFLFFLSLPMIIDRGLARRLPKSVRVCSRPRRSASATPAVCCSGQTGAWWAPSGTCGLTSPSWRPALPPQRTRRPSAR